MPAKPATSQPETFEAAIAELERIVTAMEAGDLSLEASLQNYQRGIALLRQCRGTLEAAEQRIQILENGELTDAPAGLDKE
ncbi:MAG: exodeoxyribonuclease VII small subunit [Rhodocyclaceae bacterium]